MIRPVVVIAVLLAASPAHAVPCWMVRKAVVQYGEAAVEIWARAKDISEKSRKPGDVSGDVVADVIRAGAGSSVAAAAGQQVPH
jgi:hypothetical protein